MSFRTSLYFLLFSYVLKLSVLSQPVPSSPVLETYEVILLHDLDQVVSTDEKGRAALANAFSFLKGAAFDKKLKAAISSSYINRAVPLDILKTGRDNILLASPSISYKQVGTVFKKWEVKTTVIFSDLLSMQPVLKQEAVVRNADWSQGFAEGLIECLTALLAQHPGYNVYKTRSYKNSLMETPSKEVLLAKYREAANPHPLEGLWRTENDSMFGAFEILVTREKNAANDPIFSGTIVDPMFSGRLSRRLFISFSIEEKDGVRTGIASEEHMALNYLAKLRQSGDALLVELQDPIWKSLPSFVMRRPVGWVPHFGQGKSSDSRSKETPPSVTDKESKGGSGSGFLVSRRGIVATNHHVIQGGKRITVTFPDLGDMFEAEVLATDTRNDLALLRLKAFPSEKLPEKLPWAIKGTQSVQVGAKVFTIGYPLSVFLGTKPKFSDGTISAITGPQDDPRLIQMNASIQPGNSGGPLFNNAGQIVGIVVASANAKVFFEELGVIPQNINFAVKSDYLLSLLFSEKIKIDNEFAGGEWKGSVEELAEILTRFCARISVE